VTLADLRGLIDRCTSVATTATVTVAATTSTAAATTTTAATTSTSLLPVVQHTESSGVSVPGDDVAADVAHLSVSDDELQATQWALILLKGPYKAFADQQQAEIGRSTTTVQLTAAHLINFRAKVLKECPTHVAAVDILIRELHQLPAKSVATLESPALLELWEVTVHQLADAASKELAKVRTAQLLLLVVMQPWSSTASASTSSQCTEAAK
jgi:hypothetical protein